MRGALLQGAGADVVHGTAGRVEVPGPVSLIAHHVVEEEGQGEEAGAHQTHGEHQTQHRLPTLIRTPHGATVSLLVQHAASLGLLLPALHLFVDFCACVLRRRHQRAEASSPDGFRTMV